MFQTKQSKALLFLVNIVSLLTFLTFAIKSNAKITPIPVSNASLRVAIPVEIKIENLKIDLPIYQTEISNGDWEEIDYGLLHLSNTAIPGETGNSVIYGHNTPALLGNLRNIDVGQEIVVSFSDGSFKTFVTIDSFNVTPDQTHILNTTEETKLTIYTCNGFFDEKRFVVVAVPLDA